MKKHYIFALVALLALVSCEKEQDVVDKALDANLVPLTFTASGETKTSLDEDRYIIWSKDEDHINVFSGASLEYSNEFTVTRVEDNGKTAVFSGLGAVSPEYYALFPYDENAEIDKGEITATLPCEQDAVANSFGPTANLAVARFRGSEDLQFKNVGALVGVTVGMADIDSLKLEALGANDQLTGTFHVTLEEDGTIDETTTASGSEESHNYATLTGSFESGKTYYFVVLPGTYSSGFQVKFYKGSEYVSFSKTSSVALERNGIKVFNGTPGSTWKSDFTMGENLYIRNSKEAGQKCVNITPSTYWNTSVNSDLGSYDWEYEIFTQLTGSQVFHFQAQGGERFTITSDGEHIIPIPNSSSAQYSAPVANDNLYRIRLNITSGTAEVRQITSVSLYQHGRSPESTSLTYWQKGDWFVNKFCTGKGSKDYDDRYKFRMELIVPGSDDPAVTEEYGRWNAELGNPISYPASFNEQDYFYVQPSNKPNAWDPGFKYANDNASNNYEVNDRYYVRVGLCMNDRLGHYTHTITDILDIENPIVGGTKVTIQGTGAHEAGQELAYVGNVGRDRAYWDTTTSQTSVTADYAYDYEIFTQLNANPTIYFKSNDNVLFGLYYDSGIKVKPILSTSAAGTLAASEGIYRIRMKLTINGGAVDIKQITAVKFKQHGVAYGDGEIELNQYLGNGTWKGESIPMRIDEWSWNNRYKFHFYYADDTNEYYGRYVSSYSTPNYSSDPTNYFWVQPATDDQYDPCFQFPSKYQINQDRYYGDITLSMNNGGDNVSGHYTHSVSGIIDNKDLKDLTEGEDVFIDGEGAAEQGQKLAYITTKGTDLDDVKDPTDYNYEIFTKLNASKQFFFRNADGTKKFAINTDGNGVEKISKVSAIGYGGVDESDKVYRIRLNFSTGSVSIKKVTAAYYSQPTRSDTGIYNEEMTYVGYGCWQLKDYTIDWDIKPSWGSDTKYKYFFKVQFNGVGTWQNFLKASDSNDYDTKTGTDWTWNNNTLFYASEALRNASTATITFKLNADGYTHTVTDIN